MSNNNVPQPNTDPHQLVVSASKAAAIFPSYDVDRGFMLGATTSWNPRENSGDALLIAETLIMSIQVDGNVAKAWIGEDIETETNPGRNVYADLRLAIVKLAARMVGPH